MSELLTDAATGVVAGLVAFGVGRLVTKDPLRNKIVVVVLMVLLFTIGRELVKPKLQAWSIERDYQSLLARDPLVGRILQAEPQRQAPFRATVERALREGNEEAATAAGRDLLMAVFSKYLARSSGEDLRAFASAGMQSLRKMTPERCALYLRPPPGRSPRLTAEEGRDALMRAISTAVNRVLDGKAVSQDAPGAMSPEALLEGIMDELRKRHAEGVAAMQSNTVPQEQRAAFCAATIDLYERALALPPADGARVLRYMFTL